MKPEIDAAPEAIASAIWTLASLIEAWDEARGEGKPLGGELLAEALEPMYIDPDGEEAVCLQAFKPQVLETLAHSLYATTREFRKRIEEGEAPEKLDQAAAIARSRLCGSLIVVKKLAADGLPGWIGDTWTLHGCE